MKNKIAYLLMLLPFLSSNESNGGDWTIKFNKDKQEITADSFTSFQENCAKYAAKYAEKMYEIDTEGSNDNPQKQCQLEENQKLYDLYNAASNLLQLDAKKYLVEAYQLFRNDLYEKCHTPNTRQTHAFMGYKSFVGAISLQRVDFYHPVINEVKLQKKLYYLKLNN